MGNAVSTHRELHGPRLAKARTSGRLVLDLRLGLRPGLVEAFWRILDHAERAARTAERDPEAAVHEWRKSVRRARSVLRLARPILDPEAYRSMNDALASAMRETSSLRDAHVLRETLRRLPSEPDTRAVRRRIDASLQRERGTATQPGRAAELLGAASASLAGVPEAFSKALRPEVDWADLEASLRKSHRRVRSAWKGARKHRSDEEVHEWRKRVKELRYGLEMLASSKARYVEKQHKAAIRLAEDLGEVTDLMVLHDYVRAWQAESADHDPGALVGQVRKLIRKRLARVLRRARPLVERRPKRFAKKTVKAVRPKGPRAAKARTRRTTDPVAAGAA